jgi:excisionase family DNA binding protein
MRGDVAIMQVKTNSTTATRPLTPIEAADYLGLDVKTITRWARQGYLPAHPLGEGKRKFWRFLETELSDWLSAKTNQLEAA